MVKPDSSNTTIHGHGGDLYNRAKPHNRSKPAVAFVARRNILKTGNKSGVMTNFENSTALAGAVRSDVERKSQGRDRAVLLIPDGVGVRNFILSNFLHELDALADVHVLHAIPDHLLDHFKQYGPASVQWSNLRPYTPSRAGQFLQGSVGYAHMHWAYTASMQRALARKVKGPLRSRLLVDTSKKVGWVTARLNAVEALDRVHQAEVRRSPAMREYLDIYREMRPTVLFCSHQRPTAVIPAVLAARELGIPTVSFIYSWDNLSSKARIAAPFDRYLVWSPYMRDELLRFYPEIPPDHIQIVGTPQFDPYVDSSIVWPREEFFRRVGADPNRKLICFSGGDAGTCPEDPDHVAGLMRLIRSGQIAGNPQLLVRPMPVDDGRRYQKVLDEFPEILFLRPAWIHAAANVWSQVFPSAEDVQFLANLVRHCDLNINLGSTMTLDFGLHDKPVVNIAFDIADPPLFGMPVYDYYYSYDHFQPVLKFGASRVARSADQLAEFVNAYLENPAIDREGRAQLVAQQVDLPLGRSARRTAEYLTRLSSRRSGPASEGGSDL
jgi:hypothetical protein